MGVIPGGRSQKGCDVVSSVPDIVLRQACDVGAVASHGSDDAFQTSLSKAQ